MHDIEDYTNKAVKTATFQLFKLLHEDHRDLLSLSDNISTPTANEKSSKNGKVKTNEIVLNNDLLMRILGSNMLDDSLRQESWKVLSGILGDLIKNEYQLMNLFKLSSSHFNESQRTQSLKALSEKMQKFFQEPCDLITLFKLPPNQLNKSQRILVLEALSGNLATMIKAPSDLRNLLSLSTEQFSEFRRTQIMKDLSEKLHSLIQKPSDLRSLFSLSTEQLNESQRTQILKALQSKLSVMIKNPSKLRYLFELPKKSLNNAHRKYILQNLTQHPYNLIDNIYQLIDLFEFSFEQSNQDFRMEIIELAKCTDLFPGTPFKLIIDRSDKEFSLRNKISLVLQNYISCNESSNQNSFRFFSFLNPSPKTKVRQILKLLDSSSTVLNLPFLKDLKNKLTKIRDRFSDAPDLCKRMEIIMRWVSKEIQIIENHNYEVFSSFRESEYYLKHMTRPK
jgi:hypothetical protein